MCPHFSGDGNLPGSPWEQESPLNINEFISEFVVDIDLIPVACAGLVSPEVALQSWPHMSQGPCPGFPEGPSPLNFTKTKTFPLP